MIVERLINNNSQVLLGTKMEEMGNVEKAYLACFVDTDGTLTLRVKDRWFDPRIICCNTEEREILRTLKKMTGGLGTVGRQHRYSVKGEKRIEYRYEINRHEDVEWVLKQIFPFLQLKRKRKIAQLLMEYFDIRRRVAKIAHEQKTNYIYPERVYVIQKEIARLNKK